MGHASQLPWAEGLETCYFCSESPQGKMLRRCLPSACFPGKPLVCCWPLGSLSSTRPGGEIPAEMSQPSQRPVRLLGCRCGNRAGISKVVAKVVFSPSPLMSLKVSLLGNPTPHFFPGVISLVQTLLEVKPLQQQTPPRVFHTLHQPLPSS